MHRTGVSLAAACFHALCGAVVSSTASSCGSAAGAGASSPVSQDASADGGTANAGMGEDAASPARPGSASDGGSSRPDSATAAVAHRFEADVWADNWFAAYLGQDLIMEDSVPITTERSFNAETFQFEATYPFTLNFILKDYKQDESGLEYIGLPNQQMGDGGFIAQVRDRATGLRVSVSNTDWRCLTIQRAPLNPSCEDDPKPIDTCQFESTEEPSGWKAAGFDSSAWSHATSYTPEEVSPKEGYDEIAWDPDARLIWGDDLKTVNTLLCTVTVEDAR